MKTLILVMAFALLAAACGDSSDSVADANLCKSFAEFDNFEPDFTTSGGLEVSFTALDDALQEFAQAAPSDIKDDAEFLAESFSAVISDMADADFDLNAIGDLFVALDTPELNAAGDRVDAYVTETCGNLDSGDEDSSAASPLSDSSDSDAPSDDSGDSDGITGLGGDLPDDVVESVAATLGIEPAAIQCLFDKSETLDAAGLMEDLTGPDAFQILDECGIDIADLAAGAGGLFGGTPPSADGDSPSDSDGGDFGLDLEGNEQFITILADAWGTEPDNVVCLMEKTGIGDPLDLGNSIDADFLDAFSECGIDFAGALGGG